MRTIFSSVIVSIFFILIGCNQYSKKNEIKDDSTSKSNIQQTSNSINQSSIKYSHDSICINNFCVDTNSFRLISDSGKLIKVIDALLVQFSDNKKYIQKVNKIKQEKSLLDKTMATYDIVTSRANGFIPQQSKEPEFVIEAGMYFIYNALFSKSEISKSIGRVYVSSINLLIANNISVFGQGKPFNNIATKFQEIAKNYKLLTN